MRRVTLKDLAAETGLTVATVSRALSGKDQIAAGTRARVREAAERLGYHPDPALAQLAAWRWGRPRALAGAQLAVVTDFPGTLPRYAWRRFEGMRAQAHAFGYGIEIFCLRHYRNRPERVAEVLEARGIRGVLCERVNRPGSFEGFPWERFAAIGVGIGEEELPLPLVTNDVFAAVRICWKKAVQRGYRRIGLVTSHRGRPDEWERAMAAARLEQHLNTPTCPPLEPLELRPDSGRAARTALRNWLHQTEPEAILGNPFVYGLLQNLNCPIPDDVGFVSPFRAPESPPELAGTASNLYGTGLLAVELCHQQLLRSDRSDAPNRVLHLVEPDWTEGATLPDRHAALPRGTPRSRARPKPGKPPRGESR